MTNVQIIRIDQESIIRTNMLRHLHKNEQKKKENYILLRSTKCNLVGQHVTKRLTTLYTTIFLLLFY